VAPERKPHDLAAPSSESRKFSIRGVGTLWLAAASRLRYTLLFMKIDHLGIAVHSIEEALAFYRNALGLEVTGRETVEEQGVDVVMLPVGESRVELLEARGPETPVGRFLAKRGPGLHHVCYRVDDIRTTLAAMKAAGVRLIDEEPRVGAGGHLVAFVHPSATGGVLVELAEDVSHPTQGDSL
jgi:methylmalonyl-CoA/ethylmalonyl-CoA epimerase